MKKVKAWVAAARLRTLPLWVSGIIVGASLASPIFYQTTIFWMAIFVTIGFQVVSNFANDYGDGVKGTDKLRQGEKRMVASGVIPAKQMKLAVIIAAFITFIVATLLIFHAFGNEHFFLSFVFFNLTLLALLAAIKYTVGSNAYGYMGWGDFFVFLFFGLLSVLGSYFLYTKSLDLVMFLPAISVGLFSTAVLNLNNLRDQENDAKVGKKTMVVILGSKKAKIYHMLLLLIGMLASVLFSILKHASGTNWLYLIAFIPFLWNIRTVIKNETPMLLDAELKKVALSTFLFSLLLAIFH